MDVPGTNLNRIKGQLLRGGAWATAGKLASGGVALAINALLTRILPPSDVGIFFLLLSIVSALALIAQVGMPQALVRLVAEASGSGDARGIVSTIRSAYVLVAGTTLTICVVFVTGAAEWIGGRIFGLTLPEYLVYIVAIWITAITFRGLIAESFRGLNEIKYASVFEGLFESAIFCTLLGVIALSHAHGDVHLVVSVSVISACMGLVVAGAVLKRIVNGKRSPGTASGTVLNSPGIIAIAWPIWVSSLSLFALSQVDLWVMGAMQPHAQVGIYAAVKRLVLLVSLSLMIANSVVPPLIAQMNAMKEYDALERALRATATVAAVPAFFALALFIALAGPMLRIIYGESYEEGATILIVLSLGQLVNVWSGSCGFVLMMTGHQALMMKISIFCGLLSVASAVSLVPILGGAGAALSVSAVLALQNVLMLTAVRRNLGIRTQIDLGVIWRRFQNRR